jgi:ABC-type transport system substrate-binding protein
MDERENPGAQAAHRLNRRSFLKAAMGAGGVLLLAACAPTNAPSPTKAPDTAAPAPVATQSGFGAPTAAPLPTSSAPAKVGTETLRIAIGVDPDSMDPVGQTTTTIQNIVDYICEPLVQLGEDGKIRPCLAEKWDMSPDGKTYTFKLREGVKFHDGAAFNSEAVKLSWDRVLSKDMKVPLRAPMDMVESVTPVDANTVKFTLKNVFPPFISALTATAYNIVSPNMAKSNPTSYNDQPVGTGPYAYKSRVKGSELVLARNESYWGRKPYYATAQFKIVPEAATRESLLLANQAEIIISPPMSDIPKLQSNSQVKVLLAPSNRTIFMALDVSRNTPVKEKKFRQALNYAVDKEGIIKTILYGAGDVMDAPLSNMLYGYTKVGAYAYDPAKAKQMIAEGGWAGTKLKMLYSTGRYVGDSAFAQAIIGNLKDVGIECEGATMDWPTYQATAITTPEKASSDMHVLGWAPGFLDAYQAMVQFQKAAWPPNGLASSHYTNPEVEDLLEKAAKNTNEQERAQQYAAANKIIMDDAPWIFLWVQKFPIVYSAKIKGVGSIPNEKFSCVYAEPA